MAHEIRLYGHRGASATEPENSLAAFDRALAEGATALETDVHPTRDGHFVAAHDPDGRRVAGVDRRVEVATLDDVARWRLTTHDGRPTDERVPTLRALLARYPEVPMSVDLKSANPAAAAHLVDVVHEMGAEARVTLASFHDLQVIRMRRHGYRGRTALTRLEVAALRLLPAALARRFAHGAAAQIPLRAGPLSLDTNAFIARCRGLGLRVDYWVVNNPEVARALVARGATGLITDDPARLAPALAEYLSPPLQSR